MYVHFICAEESGKQELKGHNIIGYVLEIQFKVLLRKLLYENLTFCIKIGITLHQWELIQEFI